MASPTFAQRLVAVQKRGRLTVMDLSIWFQRPYHTVRCWALHGVEPWGPDGETAKRRLGQLEALIKKKRGLPVPHGLSPQQRRAHVEGVARAANNRLPGARAS